MLLCATACLVHSYVFLACIFHLLGLPLFARSLPLCRLLSPLDPVLLFHISPCVCVLGYYVSSRISAPRSGLGLMSACLVSWFILSRPPLLFHPHPSHPIVENHTTTLLFTAGICILPWDLRAVVARDNTLGLAFRVSREGVAQPSTILLCPSSALLFRIPPPFCAPLSHRRLLP
jgi:hypothetical protein